MLDTRFPRPPGDVGHPDAFGVPVRRHVVRGAWPGTIVQTAAGLRAAGVAPAFVRAVQALEAEGARAVTTSCGFLVLLQDELQAAARVPVVTSSLLQLPGLLAHQARVGVLTISAAALGPEHLLAAGVPAGRLADVVVQGVDPAGEFATAILGNRDTLDMDKASREVVDAALALRRREPSLQAVVLECTNLPPYRQAVEAATGLKTWALTDDERLLRPWC
ncbi:hypothetical protein SAMN05720382_102501 [Polaromonas sp. JS666]|nr:hypothetical protein SAMN05720382_102501 [Polaromonas sp. JS666]